MCDMSDPVWQRLGEALQRRRVELDPKYRNLALFARERGLNERLVADIEHARRAGYRRATRHALEIAYGLDTGRIDRFVAGEVSDLAPPPASPPVLAPDDPVLEYVRRLPGLSRKDRGALEYVGSSPGLDAETRLVLVDLTRVMIARREAESRSA